jgi:hypothetical protein
MRETKRSYGLLAANVLFAGFGIYAAVSNYSGTLDALSIGRFTGSLIATLPYGFTALAILDMASSRQALYGNYAFCLFIIASMGLLAGASGQAASLVLVLLVALAIPICNILYLKKQVATRLTAEA